MRNPARFTAALCALALVLAPLPAGAQATPRPTSWVDVAAGTTDTQAVAARAPTTAVPSRNQRFNCIAATETAGSDASLDLHHGTSTAGKKIMPTITLNAGESTLKCFPDEVGPLVPNGVFANRTGTIAYAVYTRPY